MFTNAAGRIPVIFTSGLPYKVRIETAKGILIEEIDGIPGDVATAGSTSGGADLITGDVLCAYMTGGRTTRSATRRLNLPQASFGPLLFSPDGHHCVWPFGRRILRSAVPCCISPYFWFWYVPMDRVSAATVACTHIIGACSTGSRLLRQSN